MDTLFVEGGFGSAAHTFSQVQVHPVVLLSILDHHVRREAQGDRVIGALLGTVSAGGVVEVTNSFGIYHKATADEILVRRQTLNDMLELHRRVDPKEALVGWYSTWRGGAGADAAPAAGPQSALERRGGAAAAAADEAGAVDYIDQFTLVVQDFFAEAAAPVRPLHLLVDVALKTPHVRVAAYQPVLVRNIIAQFARLRLVIVASSEERIAVDAMAQAARLHDHALPLGGPVPVTGDARELAPDLDSLENSLRRLKSLIDTSCTYVDEVVAGKREGSEAQGRAIADAVASLPSLDVARLQAAAAASSAGSAGASTAGSIVSGGTLGTAMKDLLLVTYLTQLAQVHLKIADRLVAVPTGPPGS